MKLPIILILLAAGLSHLGAAAPTPVSVLGKTPGEDFYLARYDELQGYFKALAASSDRVRIFDMGKSTRGLEFQMVAISSPANLAKLDHYKGIAARLAQGRGLDDTTARALAAEGKAIVHIDGGLHSSEVAGAQHTPVLAHRLVSAVNDPEVDAILDNVILLLWPTINPDGHNMIVDWYRKNLGTPYEVAPMPWLYQEYVGHDNNRDGYMLNMAESRVVTRAQLEWNPVIFYCHHQTAPMPARIWIPPFADPISSNVNPLMLRWLNTIGSNIATRLDEKDMPGAVHRARFDNWYAGFLDYTNIFRHSISFFTETALFQYATPKFYTVTDFPKDKQSLETDPFYASPWKGGWWRLGDAVRYNVEASMSVLDTAAKYRESLLFNRYRAARDTIERFHGEAPYAYVVPADQRDTPTAAILMGKLLLHGIEIHTTAQPLAANGREYPAGSWLILMDQPYAGLVKELFEPQVYPLTASKDHLPYDVTGWTLPLQMGVETAALTAPVTDTTRRTLTKITEAKVPVKTPAGSGEVFAASLATNASYRWLNAALAAGAQATVEGETVYVSKLKADDARSLSQKFSVALQAQPKPAEKGSEVKAARVGLYRPWRPSMDEGWTRWIFEDYAFGARTITREAIIAGRLRENFDVIVIPDIAGDQLLEGFAIGVVPQEYVGGLAGAPLAALNQFVREGGTLTVLNRSAAPFIAGFGLPVKDVLAGLKDTDFFCSGALFGIETAREGGRGVAGLPASLAVMFERGPAFETTEGFQGKVLARYTAKGSPLLSGFAVQAEKVQGKIAALEVTHGQGKVVLIGFRPQWRGQSHGAYKFLFNTLYLSPAAPSSAAAH